MSHFGNYLELESTDWVIQAIKLKVIETPTINASGQVPIGNSVAIDRNIRKMVPKSRSTIWHDHPGKKEVAKVFLVYFLRVASVFTKKIRYRERKSMDKYRSYMVSWV